MLYKFKEFEETFDDLIFDRMGNEKMKMFYSVKAHSKSHRLKRAHKRSNPAWTMDEDGEEEMNEEQEGEDDDS